jgi:DNA-binding HxlR family transcriptional regulator
MRKTNSTNHRNEANLVATCPLAAAMKLLGGRWKVLLVWYIHHGIDQFGRLRTTTQGISEKMLYQQLRELERDTVLMRVISGRHVNYALTDFGRSVVPHLEALANWSSDNQIATRLYGKSGAFALESTKREAAR